MMKEKRPNLPRTTSSLRIKQAVKKLKTISQKEHLQLLVKARLIKASKAKELTTKLDKSSKQAS
jgi:hypothetical protein